MHLFRAFGAESLLPPASPGQAPKVHTHPLFGWSRIHSISGKLWLSTGSQHLSFVWVEPNPFYFRQSLAKHRKSTLIPSLGGRDSFYLRQALTKQWKSTLILCLGGAKSFLLPASPGQAPEVNTHPLFRDFWWSRILSPSGKPSPSTGSPPSSRLACPLSPGPPWCPTSKTFLISSKLWGLHRATNGKECYKVSTTMANK